jgi:transcriptional regulator with XRE-family HTH domain
MRYKVGKCLLADRLNALGLTQTDLSRITGIPKGTLNGYVSGKSMMKLDNARTIATALKCEIYDLYEWQSVE